MYTKDNCVHVHKLCSGQHKMNCGMHNMWVEKGQRHNNFQLCETHEVVQRTVGSLFKMEFHLVKNPL